MNVAFFGGSFNPPHIAHVLAASYARQVGFDKVLVVLVGSHAFGKTLADFEHRLAMCQLAFAPLEGVEVTDVERTLPQPNYTLHTIRHVMSEHPEWRLRLLVGSDVLHELDSWHQSKELQRLAPSYVLERVGHPTTGEHPAVLPDVSSSEVRRRFAEASAKPFAASALGNGEKPAHGENAEASARWLRRYVPKAVIEYAQRSRLYSDL